MKSSDPIPYSSCHKCNPETWKVIRVSNYLWKCKGCGKTTNKILERKE